MSRNDAHKVMDFINLLQWVFEQTLLRNAMTAKLGRKITELNERINEWEKKLATVDQEMRERLDDASSRVAARLDTLIEKVSRLEADQQGAVDAALLADAQADADALRPSVEFLERLGGSDSEVVPDTDPVPADNAGVENAPVVEGPAPVAPSEGSLVVEDENANENETPRQETAEESNNNEEANR